MKLAVFFIVILFSTVMTFTVVAENLYTWTDSSGNLHITDEAPPQNAIVKDIFRYEARKTDSFQAPKPKERNTIHDAFSETNCQDVREMRTKAQKTIELAEEATQRAIEARVRADGFRRKVGFDDDRIQQFKYKMKKLEDQAEEAQLLAREANDRARQAELQAKLAELEAGDACL